MPRIAIKNLIPLLLLFCFSIDSAQAISIQPVTNVTVPTTSTTGNFTVSWTGGDLYTKTLYESKDGGGYVTVSTIGAGTSSYSLTNRSDGVYQYRVKVCGVINWWFYCSSYAYSNTISVVPPSNDPPTADNDSAVTSEDVIVNINVLSGDSDPDGDALIPVIYSNPSHGAVSVNTDKTVRYTPDNSYSGSDSFTYRAQDPSNAYSNVATVSITIVPVNDIPAYANDTETTVANATLVNPTNITQQAVGAVQGQAGVSGGSASYSIPVIVPPGRAGMQPNVSISYSSQSGNGTLGMGWAVSTGSSISRCGQSVAQDGVNLAVTYNSTDDRLCFNGQRLIADIGVYGVSGTTYRTEIDGFTRITQNGGGINSSGTWFKAEFKSGKISQFGNSSNSRITPDGAPAILSWLLNQQSDRSQTANTVDYIYQDFGSGEHHISQINYTSSTDRQVIFNYENRPDITTSYLAGGLTRQSKRLANITTEYLSNTVRQYRFTYIESRASKRSLLDTVVDCGYIGTSASCLPATNMSWSDKEQYYTLEKVGYRDANGSLIEQLQDRRYMSASFGSDDVNDIAPKGDADGNGVVDWPTWDMDAEGKLIGTKTDELATCGTNYLTHSRYCLSLDVDQDGRTDSWRKSDSTLQLRYSANMTWFSTSIALTNSSYNQAIVNISDYNGDGWPDLVLEREGPSGPNSNTLYLYTHSGNTASPYSNNEQLMYTFLKDSQGNVITSVQYMGDMDGNGLPDFMVSNNHISGGLGEVKSDQPIPNTLYLTKRSSSGNLSFDTWYISGLMESGTVTSYVFHYFMDINGDGLQDWMAWSENGGELRVRINLGAEQFSEWRSIAGGNFLLTQVFIKTFNQGAEELPVEYPRYLASIRQHDMDADGRAELLFPDNIPVIESCRRIQFGGSGTPLLCGEELYTEVQDDSSAAGQQDAYGNRWDESIYRYKAVKFHQELDGNFTAEVTTTELIGSATQTASIDAFGNGLSDFVFAYGCRQSSGLSGDCTFQIPTNPIYPYPISTSAFGVYINRNRGSATSNDTYQATDMLIAVENGLDYRDEWEYRPLTSRDDEFHSSSLPFYERDDAYLAGLSAEAQQAHLHFASSMYVVAEHRYSNGVDSRVRS